MFAVSCLAVSSQTCPSDHFSAVFVAAADQTVDQPILAVADPELTFFREIMKFRDADIRHFAEDAIYFFNETYGLDFSTSLPPNDQHELFYENAKMNPFFLSKDIKFTVTSNNWIQTGRTRSSCYQVSDGGFQVSFLGDQTLYGSYGGAEGKPAGITEGIGYGFYRIDACQQSPIILQWQSMTPLRMEPVDGIIVINQEQYNRVLGHGKGQGIATFTPDPNEPGKLHLTIRNVITFPAQQVGWF